MDLELIWNYSQILRNVKQYNQDLPTCDVLQDRLANHQDWYYSKELDKFGPSKFIGFVDITCDRYRTAREDYGRAFDGGRTEQALRPFSRELNQHELDYRHLCGRLEILLSQYGKRPKRGFSLKVLMQP